VTAFASACHTGSRLRLSGIVTKLYVCYDQVHRRIFDPGLLRCALAAFSGLKHIGCLSIFVGLFLLTNERQAAGWSLFKNRICTIFPAEQIVRETDAGNGYKHDKKQVYESYNEIAVKLIAVYRSAVNKQRQHNFEIAEAYDISGPVLRQSIYAGCHYTIKIEYDAKRLGIKTTNQWIKFPNYFAYINNKDYLLGKMAFALYDILLKFSDDDGDLLEVHVLKYNVNFDRFPFYATSLELRIPESQREQGLNLKKMEFPHG
jgi:hypothetical protein